MGKRLSPLPNSRTQNIVGISWIGNILKPLENPIANRLICAVYSAFRRHGSKCQQTGSAHFARDARGWVCCLLLMLGVVSITRAYAQSPQLLATQLPAESQLAAKGKDQRATAATEWVTGNSLFGINNTVQVLADDTLHTIARRFGFGLDELVLANPNLDKWLPSVGSNVLLPGKFLLPSIATANANEASAKLNGGQPQTPAQRIIVNLPENRLYFISADAVKSYPVGVGRMAWRTPDMSSHISEKLRDPSWTPPLSIRKEAAEKGEELALVYLPGPMNPLGKFALRIGNSSYLIHGTNKPYGVGSRVSHGCLRMYPEHIETLFELVSEGTVIDIVNEPIKLGWQGNQLFLEVHPFLEEEAADPDSLLQTATELVFEAIIEKHQQEGVLVRLLDEALSRAVVALDGIPRQVGVVEPVQKIAQQ